MATVSEDIAALIAADGTLQTTMTAAVADLQALIVALRAAPTVTPDQVAALEKVTADLGSAAAALAAADPGTQPPAAPPAP